MDDLCAAGARKPDGAAVPPPSRSPQRWCSATKAIRTLGTSGIGPLEASPFAFSGGSTGLPGPEP